MRRLDEASRERLIAAIDELDRGARVNVERTQEIRRRLRRYRRELARGRDLSEILDDETPPRAVELLSANMQMLESAGSQLRISQAQALRREGLTLDQIAGLFGVTRQRIAGLLKQRPAPEPASTSRRARDREPAADGRDPTRR